MKTSLLLKQLSSDPGLKILNTLKNKPSCHNELLKDLNFFSSNLTNHLHRLTGYNFIERNTDNKYHLTSLGSLLLSHITSLDYISQHKQFFKTHDSSSIPHFLKNNLGDLQNSKMVVHGYHSPEKLVNKIKDESDFLWIISNDNNETCFNHIEDLIDRDIDIKLITSRKFAVKDWGTESEKIKNNIKFRVHDGVDLVLCVNDSFAYFGLPEKDRSKTWDILVYSNDDSFKQWCKKCFSYYWDQSSPIFEKPLF
jgi:predicted transcriptional regulator